MKSPVDMITADKALPGRDDAIVLRDPHLFYATTIGEVPSDAAVAFFGMGCFWGAEKSFWSLDGVFSTAAGYQGGFTKNPTYQEVCTGLTGHAEVVRVIYDPSRCTFEQLVRHMLEHHDPTQGFRQGGDIGTQYRSAIYVTSGDEVAVAHHVIDLYQGVLDAHGYGTITTEVGIAGLFYFAEEYHQQYLIANPNGYCGLGGTGVSCPVGLGS
jgi:peptide-methionine (S)-S-oxide reductase